MILILSEESDQITNLVIDWLIYKNHKFIRLNRDDFNLIELRLSADSQHLIFKFKNEYYDLNQFDGIWYRRGNLNYVSDIDLETINDKELVQEVEKHLIDEWKNLVDFFHYLINKNKCLGNFFNSNINKLICLSIAKECGLTTPDTLIIRDIQKIQKFKDTHNQIITKGIQESASFTTKLYYLQNYTEEIFEYESSKFVEFFPTLFQQKLEKDYELRIFYLYGEFYSMAIFSQLDTQTQTDFRKYNDIKPNRTVPYTLPINIANNLRQFMNKIDLNTGSIDMVVTKGKRYVFLEVNPVGQFGMVSIPCNYYLEKKIAECLSSK